MVAKSYSYDVLSNKKCSRCGRKLKKRIAEEHPKFNKCYRCFKRLPAKEKVKEE